MRFMKKLVAVILSVFALHAHSQSFRPSAPDIYFTSGWCPRPDQIATLSKYLTLTMNGCCIDKGTPISPSGVPPSALTPWASKIIQNYYPKARCDGSVMSEVQEKDAAAFFAEKAEQDERVVSERTRLDRLAGVWPPQTRERCLSASISNELSSRKISMLECLELVQTEGKKLSAELAAKGTYFVQAFGLWDVNSAGGVEPYATFVNPSQSDSIKYITLQIAMYNAVGDRISSTIGRFSTGSIQMTGPLANEDGLREARWAPIWYNHSAKCIQVTSVQVQFMNKKSITFSGPTLNRAFHPDVAYQCSAPNKIR